jgi:hypothetical protein
MLSADAGSGVGGKQGAFDLIELVLVEHRGHRRVAAVAPYDAHLAAGVDQVEPAAQVPFQLGILQQGFHGLIEHSEFLPALAGKIRHGHALGFAVQLQRIDPRLYAACVGQHIVGVFDL